MRKPRSAALLVFKNRLFANRERFVPMNILTLIRRYHKKDFPVQAHSDEFCWVLLQYRYLTIVIRQLCQISDNIQPQTSFSRDAGLHYGPRPRDTCALEQPSGPIAQREASSRLTRYNMVLRIEHIHWLSEWHQWCQWDSDLEDCLHFGIRNIGFQ